VPTKLSDLDVNQNRAVVSDARFLRILAGAGTGKTTTLTRRVAHQIATDQLVTDRALLLTFTRRAARAMVHRVGLLLHTNSAEDDGGGSSEPLGTGSYSRNTPDRIAGGTFHSIAHRILRQHSDAVGLPDGFGILDPSDAADLFDLLRDDHASNATLRRRIPRKSTLVDIYSRAVNTSETVSDVLTSIAPWARDDTDLIANICRDYVKRKRALGVLDFDDLLLYWLELLRNDQLRAHIAGRFDHVFVDEYQDMNRLQVQLLKAMTADDQRLTVVGDDAQAIYSFRGSSPTHILDFASDFVDARTVILGRNYRSTQRILDAANAIGEAAPRGFSAKLTAHKNEAGSDVVPALVRCADEDGQSDAVCERVLDLREHGVPLKEQAVLVRAAHHSARLELELTARGIPFVKYGGLKYLDAAHVKDLLATFRLADNARDELSWFRVLQLLPGVGPATARRVIQALGVREHGERRPQLAQQQILLRWPVARSQLPSGTRVSADAVVASLERATTETLSAHADRIRRAVVPLVEEKYDDGPSRVNDLGALVDATGSALRLSEVAGDYALEPPSSTGDLAGAPVIDEDWLVISTIHSAKGLEFDAIHLIHAADGNIPLDMSLKDSDGLEEERRLFYVATTRARSYLGVYVPLRFHVNRHARDDRHIWAQPSRFLSGAVGSRFEEITHLRPQDLGVIDLPTIDVGSAVGVGLNDLWR
jgi:DNA helicase-2/ATP-dependent DNA helicase PcrA